MLSFEVNNATKAYENYFTAVKNGLKGAEFEKIKAASQSQLMEVDGITYFANIKELEIGDEIIYKTKYGTKKYKVNLTIVIQDTDWSYLQETKENKITLITCVENQPSNRRCIQAVEIKEE